MDDIISIALELGFSHACALDCSTLTLLDEVRDMCSSDRCGNYGHSWMCPPALASLDENRREIAKYSAGIIVQTTGQLDDDFDFETMQETGALQKRQFFELRNRLRVLYPDLLALTSGGCELCKPCAYPDAPCRHPKDAMPSMEAYGLLVSDVCERNGLPYYYGPCTITYTGCLLLF